ncbi:MAG: adenylyltransferase/cytidyltransferase family protein [Terracidiphilus sp.]
MNHSHYGVVLGRFQPLHIGHVEYLEAARNECDRLVIGITNPDIGSIRFNAADPNRSKSESNPFSYFERHEMIHAALRDFGWEPSAFAIVPADVADLSRVGVFLPDPAQTTVFITIYDAWGEEKAHRMSDLGYRVHILWRREMASRVTSGTALRTLMRRNEAWRHLVPPAIATYVDKAGFAERPGMNPTPAAAPEVSHD